MSTPNPAAERGLSLPFAGKGSPLGRKGRRSDFIQENGRFGEGFWGPNTHFKQETTLGRYKRFRVVRGGSTSPVATAALVVPGGSYSTPKGAGRGSAPRFTSRAVLPTLAPAAAPGSAPALPALRRVCGRLGWR